MLFELEEAFCLEPIKVGDTVVLTLPEDLGSEDQEALARALRQWYRNNRDLKDNELTRDEYVSGCSYSGNGAFAGNDTYSYQLIFFAVFARFDKNCRWNRVFQLVSHLQDDFEITKFTWVMLLHFRMTHFVSECKNTP